MCSLPTTDDLFAKCHTQTAGLRSRLFFLSLVESTLLLPFTLLSPILSLSPPFFSYLFSLLSNPKTLSATARVYGLVSVGTEEGRLLDLADLGFACCCSALGADAAGG